MEYKKNIPQSRHGKIFKSGAYFATSNTMCMVLSINHFPTFDPQEDVSVGMFKAIKTKNDNQSKGIQFLIAKIINMER